MNIRWILLRSIMIVTVVAGFATKVGAWYPYDPPLLGGHGQIAHDAIDAIASPEYPDIIRFHDELVAGSDSEAHNPPPALGVPCDKTYALWWPEPENWFANTDLSYKPCVLQLYASGNFAAAYRHIGYMLHNYQDRAVPAHQCRCIHGTLRRWSDDLEYYAFLHHGYADTSTPWWFNTDFWIPEDEEYITVRWHYWLSDTNSDPSGAGDDDDEDWRADGSSLPDIPDDDGDSNANWGVPIYGFGSYGYDENPEYHYSSDCCNLPGEGPCWCWCFPSVDNHPGLNNGKDYFVEMPNDAIAREQLKEAFDASVDVLVAKSEALPPRVSGLSFYPKTFGPERQVSISFTAEENRKPAVRIWVYVYEENKPITDVSGYMWHDVRHNLDVVITDLPYGRQFYIDWKGRLDNCALAETGQYTIEVSALDVDYNSAVITGTIKYDKTPPTAQILVDKGA